MKRLIFIFASLMLAACGSEESTPSKSDLSKEKSKTEFSCKKSKTEIDAELKKQASGEVNEPEYWELRQMEYNEKCQKIYDVE